MIPLFFLNKDGSDEYGNGMKFINSLNRFFLPGPPNNLASVPKERLFHRALQDDVGSGYLVSYEKVI